MFLEQAFFRLVLKSERFESDNADVHDVLWLCEFLGKPFLIF